MFENSASRASASFGRCAERSARTPTWRRSSRPWRRGRLLVPVGEAGRSLCQDGCAPSAGEGSHGAGKTTPWRSRRCSARWPSCPAPEPNASRLRTPRRPPRPSGVSATGVAASKPPENRAFRPPVQFARPRSPGNRAISSTQPVARSETPEIRAFRAASNHRHIVRRRAASRTQPGPCSSIAARRSARRSIAKCLQDSSVPPRDRPAAPCAAA